MSEQSQYSSADSSQRVDERLNRLEASVRRVLSMQGIDDLPFVAGLAQGSWKSIGCSAVSYQCGRNFQAPQGPEG